MTDQKPPSPSQKNPSPLSPEQRRRMREAAEAAARVAEEPLVLRGDGWRDPWLEDARGGEVIVASRERGAYVRHAFESSPSAVLALFDWLKEQEEAASWCAVQLRQVAAERDALREKLAAAERRVAELDPRQGRTA